MIEWQIFFKMNFWPNYISCCTACKDSIVADNPYKDDFPIIQVKYIGKEHNLKAFTCSHNFGGVAIGAS